MNRRESDRTESAELRAKIHEAKLRLPLPELMSQLGLAEHGKKSARCLWHDDQHPSFSVFKGKDGFWHYKCFVCDPSGGDEITFLVKHFSISRREAIKRYLEIAGFPASRPPKSHEYRKCPEYPVSPVSPVSNGQGLDKQVENMLVRFGSGNACTEPNTARKKLWKLARDLKAIEKGTGRKLPIAAPLVAFNEWHRLSQRFLDPAKSYDDYLADFLAGLGKVCVPTGEGDRLKKALGAVGKLSASELPVIPAMPNAPESWRRVTALHRELSQQTGGKTHFLTCRDAAKASPGLSHQTAYNINVALASPQLGVIKIVSKGKAGPNSKKAAEFRYLISESGNQESAA